MKDNTSVDINHLVNKYSNKVFNMAYYLAGNHHDAQDLAQETFIKVINAIRSGICDVNLGIEGYFYRVMKNLHLDNIREKSKEPVVSADEALPNYNNRERIEFVQEAVPGPDSVMEKKNIGEKVRNALNQIPSEFKIPVIMCDIEGRSYKEISIILKCPEGTVRSRIHRGRKYLSELLYKDLRTG